MTIIDALAAVGPFFGIALVIVLLALLTSLPFWVVILISLPLGGILGIAGGIGAGIAIEWLLNARRNR